MSCNSCQSKFSLFTREKGCPNCGFAYCSKCLKYKNDLPNIGVKKVCGPCHNKLNSTMSEKPTQNPAMPDVNPAILNTTPLAPVEITKRLENLENPAKPPIVMYKQGSHWEKLKSGLSQVDQDIVDRLRKLKDEDKQIALPTVEDIRRRLNELKGENYQPTPVNVHQVDSRSDQQKTDDLLQEYFEKMQLMSAASTKTQDLEERLNVLKGLDPKVSSSKESYENVDEETATKNIIKKALVEAALEKKHEEEELEDMEVSYGCNYKDSDEEEAQCVMCDNTKNLVVCSGCQGDLFCPSCFEHNHDEFELAIHKTKPFK